MHRISEQSPIVGTRAVDGLQPFGATEAAYGGSVQAGHPLTVSVPRIENPELSGLEQRIHAKKAEINDLKGKLAGLDETIRQANGALHGVNLRLQRLERVKKMDGDEWSLNLEHAVATLNDPVKSVEQKSDALVWLEVLVHHNPNHVPLELIPIFAFAIIVANAPVQPETNKIARREGRAASPEEMLAYEEATARYTLEHLENAQRQLYRTVEAEIEGREDIEQQQENERYELELNISKTRAEHTLDEHTKSLLEDQRKLLSGVQEQEQDLQKLEMEHTSILVKLEYARRKKATEGYQRLVDEAREIAVVLKGEMSLTAEQVAAQTLAEVAQRDAQIADAKRKFKAKILELQMYDAACVVENGGENPYLDGIQQSWFSQLSSYVRGGFYDNPLFKPSRPSVDDLVLEYQLALHGQDSIMGAYRAMFATLSIPDFSSAWDALSLETIRKVLIYPAQFALDHPTYAARLAADIAQTAAILGLTDTDQNFGPILKRRTAQNQVTDRVLGRYRVLHGVEAMENLPEISLAELAMLDFARKAPYVAGVINQNALLGGQAAQSAAAWIPGIGSWKPVQLAAGAAGAIAQVRVQQELSEQMSRQMEVTANAVLTGFQSYQNGGLAGAARDAGLYLARREAAVQLGNWMRAGIEGSSVRQRLADFAFPERHTHLSSEVAKSTISGAVGAAFGFLAAGALVAATGGAVALPMVVAAGSGTGLFGFLGAKKGVDALSDVRKSQAELDADKAAEDAARLVGAYKRIRSQRPELPEFSDAQLTTAGEAGLPKLIEQQADRDMAGVIPEAATQAHLEPAQVAKLITQLQPQAAPAAHS